jgi:hypothetical protein
VAQVVGGPGREGRVQLARPQREGVNEQGEEARLAVVEPARGVDGHEHVVVEVPRVGVRGGPIGARRAGGDDLPGAGAEEVFARHRREGLYERRRAQV